MSKNAKNTSIQDILEQLAEHCAAVSGNNVDLKVTLPTYIIENFSKSYTVKGFDPDGQEKTSEFLIIKLFFSSGTVELIPAEDVK